MQKWSLVKTNDIKKIKPRIDVRTLFCLWRENGILTIRVLNTKTCRLISMSHQNACWSASPSLVSSVPCSLSNLKDFPRSEKVMYAVTVITSRNRYKILKTETLLLRTNH